MATSQQSPSWLHSRRGEATKRIFKCVITAPKEGRHVDSANIGIISMVRDTGGCIQVKFHSSECKQYLLLLI